MAPTVDRTVMRTMSTAPASMVYPRTLDADVQAARFTPAEFWLDVTLDSVRWIEAKTRFARRPCDVLLILGRALGAGAVAAVATAASSGWVVTVAGSPCRSSAG